MYIVQPDRSFFVSCSNKTICCRRITEKVTAVLSKIERFNAGFMVGTDGGCMWC
jgi:hypothetical protein